MAERTPATSSAAEMEYEEVRVVMLWSLWVYFLVCIGVIMPQSKDADAPGLGGAYSGICVVSILMAADAVTKKTEVHMKLWGESRPKWCLAILLGLAIGCVPFVILSYLTSVSKIPGCGLFLIYGGVTALTLLLAADTFIKAYDGNLVALRMSCRVITRSFMFLKVCV